MAAAGLDRVAADARAQADWVEHARQAAEATLMPRAGSRHVGASIPGKKRVYMPYFGGFDRYAALCEETAADGYPGFALGRHGEGGRTDGTAPPPRARARSA